jgi:photosystem II stability/assembly factor-like uncharacterized protein
VEAVVENISKKFNYVSIVICILFLCQIEVYSQRTWYSQSSGTTEDIHGLAIGYRYKFCLVGANGLIMTGQEHNTPSKCESGVQVSLHDVYFCGYSPDDPISSWGYVVGDSGTILKTTDAGLTWTKLQSTITANLYGVFFVNPAKGFAVGDSGVLLATSDSGATWKRQDVGVTKNLHSVHLFSRDYSDIYVGVIAGDNGTLLLTTDTGNTWIIKSVNSTVNFNKAKIVYNGACVVGDSGVVLRSTDYCNTFNTVVTGVLAKLRGIILSSGGGQSMVIVGDSGTILQNFNNPDVLTIDSAGTNSTLYGGYSYVGGCSLPFWVVGSTGTMMLKDIGGLVRDPRPIQADADYRLHQNYPNPFNPTTNISFQIPNAAHIILDLFSITGEKISSLVNEHLQGGYYTQQINSQSLHLASGTYLCRMTAVGDGSKKIFTQTQKLVLLK